MPRTRLLVITHADLPMAWQTERQEGERMVDAAKRGLREAWGDDLDAWWVA